MRRWLNILAILCRFGLAAMWLFAAGAKLYTFRDFSSNLANLVPYKWAAYTAALVVAAELLAAVLLLVGRTARVGAIWTAVLLAGFAGYALFYVYVLKGEPLECGCFGGIIGSQLGVKTALRNLALLVPAFVVIFGSRCRPRFR